MQFSAADYTVAEGFTRTITVTLSAPVSVTVTVDYITMDGTAVAGSDYAATGGTLTFAAGETTQTFVVVTQDDDQNEPNETIILNLSDPTGVVLGSTDTATLTILDDDYIIFLPLIFK